MIEFDTKILGRECTVWTDFFKWTLGVHFDYSATTIHIGPLAIEYPRLGTRTDKF